MKALSLGLVKGSIDQLSQEVNMTWVQPRVLDIDQVCDEDQQCLHGIYCIVTAHWVHIVDR